MTTSAAALQSLWDSVSTEDAHRHAETLTEYINTNGLRTLLSERILDELLDKLKDKKQAHLRERAAIGLGAVASKVAGKNAPMPLGAEPWLVNAIPPLLDGYGDKNEAAKKAAEGAMGALVPLFPPEAAAELLEMLYSVITSGTAKWQAKVAPSRLSAASLTLRTSRSVMSSRKSRLS